MSGGGGGGAGGVFGGETGTLRLLNESLGGQAGWLLGFAVVALVALVVVSRLRRTDLRTGFVIAKVSGGPAWLMRTQDGGKTWKSVGTPRKVNKPWIATLSVISMPDEDTLIVGAQESLLRSKDNGQTWRYLSRPAPDTGSGGNPPAMIQLQDGRLCLCFGLRAPPYGIRARLSDDGGQSWGPEIALRDDGGNHDLGYPRAVQRPDGAIVTAYYFNERADGERFIGATIWRT